MDTRPIGIFDSGIGGLTVAHAIHKLMPSESLLYFGDTAHMPYGDKSAHAILEYSQAIAQWLIGQQCKAVVIACNTASATAFREVSATAAQSGIPVFNVIDPVVAEVAKCHPDKAIGVIATKRTVQSKMYARRIKSKVKQAKVASLATPLLAPMIEEGFFNNTISQTIINSYLEKPTLKGIEALILACTHYPLIKPEIKRYYGNKVAILDSAQIVAQAVKQGLSDQKALNSSKQTGKLSFYVSDYTRAFERTTKLFFGKSVPLSEANIWQHS